MYSYKSNALHVVYTDAFMEFTSGILSVTGINATGHIFASYPGRHLTILGGFVDQVNIHTYDIPQSTIVVIIIIMMITLPNLNTTLLILSAKLARRI